MFGNDFVKRYKKVCKFIYQGTEYKLIKNFQLKNLKKIPKFLEVIFIGIENVTDFSFMFQNSHLKQLSGVSKLDTRKITNMSSMFENCGRLSSLPDISKWNISNVTNISKMFEGCESLKSLPDISKWNTSKII